MENIIDNKKTLFIGNSAFIIKKDSKNYNLISNDNRFIVPVNSVESLISKDLTEEESITALITIKSKCDDYNMSLSEQEYIEVLSLSYEDITNIVLSMLEFESSPEKILELLENIKEGYLAYIINKISYMSIYEKGKILYAIANGDLDDLGFQKHL